MSGSVFKIKTVESLRAFFERADTGVCRYHHPAVTICEKPSNVFYEIGFAHALKKDVIFIPITLAQAVCRGNPDITVGILANGTHAKV